MFDVIERPGFYTSVVRNLQAEAISWWRAEIASVSLAKTAVIARKDGGHLHCGQVPEGGASDRKIVLVTGCPVGSRTESRWKLSGV